MAVIQSGALATDLATVDPQSKGLFSCNVPRGLGFCLSVDCGQQAAAVLAAGAKVFGMRTNPSGATRVYFTQITVTTFVQTVFTTPASSVRQLGIIRANGAAFTGGTAIATMRPHRIGFAASVFDSASGGDVRFTNAIAGLSGGPTFPAATAGAIYDRRHPMNNGTALVVQTSELIRADAEPNPIILNPGDCLALINATGGTGGEASAAAAFDAAGIVAIKIDLSWVEAPLIV